MKNYQYKKSAIALMLGVALSLTACQTVSNGGQTLQANLATPTLQASQIPANEALMQAVRTTLHSSFSYHSHISYSNQLREQALSKATASQLAQSDDFATACEHTHDVGYVNLAKKAMADGLDISADRYISEREKLKSDFLACKADFNKQADETGGELDVPKNYGQYTALDQRQAQLLKDYWYGASSVQVIGSYQPLKGVITALPTANYASRNAHLTLTQPTLIDTKAGKIYLWADNLALANAKWLDKKLGLAWQDKWLAIDLNDGSLPSNFVKELGKAFADSRILAVADSTSYLSQDEFEKLLANADKSEQAILKSASQVIVENHTESDSLSQFYKTMTQNYPELLEAPSDPEKVVLNSKTLMQRSFALLKKRLDRAEQDTPVAPMSYYGIKNGKVVWHFHQNTLPQKNAGVAVEPIIVGVLTKLDNQTVNPFAKLPTAHQTPNASNQVDLFKYSNKLLAELRQGDDTAAQLVARTMLAVLVGFDANVGDGNVESDTPTNPATEPSQDF